MKSNVIVLLLYFILSKIILKEKIIFTVLKNLLECNWIGIMLYLIIIAIVLESKIMKLKKALHFL